MQKALLAETWKQNYEMQNKNAKEKERPKPYDYANSFCISL